MWLRTVQAVLWSFLGIRKRSEFEKDVKNLNPVVILAVGVAMAMVFVLSLMVIVNLVV